MVSISAQRAEYLEIYILSGETTLTFFFQSPPLLEVFEGERMTLEPWLAPLEEGGMRIIGLGPPPDVCLKTLGRARLSTPLTSSPGPHTISGGDEGVVAPLKPW